jgi:putative acetyltransferase
VQAREERSDDAEAVAEVHRAAFGGHGAVVAALVEDLRAGVTSGDGLSLVAERDGGVVGHVMFSRGLLDAPARLVAVQILSPVGVRPAMQGQGIAAALIGRGLEILSARRVPAVFLEGDPGYYSRLGFVPAKALGFRKPSLRIPDAAFQVMTLSAHEPWMTGTVVYHDAFWRHDAVGLRDRATAEETSSMYPDGFKVRPPELP